MAIAKEWFTVDEAAEYLCVSKRTIYKLTQLGRLPAFRLCPTRHPVFAKRIWTRCRDRARMSRTRQPRYILFSAGGFTPHLRERACQQAVLLVGPGELFPEIAVGEPHFLRSGRPSVAATGQARQGAVRTPGVCGEGQCSGRCPMIGESS